MHRAPTTLNPTPRLGAAVKRGSKRLLALVLLIGPPVIITLIFLMAPKAETPRSEPLPPGDVQLVAVGDVGPGSSDHHAEGTAQVYWNGTGHFLRFEGYQADAGPNVWFYLTRAADPQTEDEVEREGLLVRVPGPGQATYRGDFNVPLPMEYGPDEYPAVVAWDRTFDVRYSLTPLDPVPPEVTDDDTMTPPDGNHTQGDPAKGP